MEVSSLSIAKMFGDRDLGIKNEICELHGPYESQGMRFGEHESWGGCAQCIEISNRRLREDSLRADEAERTERRLRNAFGRACIPKRFQNKTFATYFADTEAKRRALAICTEYAEKFEANEQSGPSLILCGRLGTGKTHPACAIADYLVRNGRVAVFSRVFDAVRTIKATWSRDSEMTETQAIRSFIEPDLLILDEVGVQFGSETEMLLVFEIINGRYEAVKPTILLSNLPITELKNFIGERVMDRLREGGGKFIAFDWESFRSQA